MKKCLFFLFAIPMYFTFNVYGGTSMIRENSLVTPRLKVQWYFINGVKQAISISASDTSGNKPILLFLHGGPGSANMSLIHTCCPEIEKYAVVVSWDQRGAGKSFDPFASTKYLTVDQMVSDAHELTSILKRQFSVDRICLIGFSWGTALGILLCKKYPEDYSCFISIAQMVEGIQGEKLSLEYVQKEAHNRNDLVASKKLNNIIYNFNDPTKLFKQTMVERKYLLKYNGIYSTKTSYAHEVSSLWLSKEYSFIDFLLWPLGSARSLKTMWYEVVHLDLGKLAPTINVPVVFMSGKNDMNNPTSLVEKYYMELNAPAGKELIVFEKSAHSIFWDEPKELEKRVVLILSHQAQSNSQR